MTGQKTLGQIAYEAYQTWNGLDFLMTWNSASPALRASWEVVAEAVKGAVLADLIQAASQPTVTEDVATAHGD